ncbi:permease prefix domain 1-containing protein [Paraclostridium ghonii]|uniref:DUF1700 domain-containing protein n=1 Tax=Paraclostridium ghonii TaxID=29358 RepID=A0ABU0N2A7_9FIRM|nr:permease prefix domain 1-containing protein [Paeniclostridium ghonii]MDQ0557255.1 hypothetical protein [Paeniclostridium ghonii]
MKIIDEYLISLYKNDKSKEVKELKEELREHLITSSEDFISQGYSKEDAQNEAIKQFDGGTEMLKDLHKSLKESKAFNEKLNKRMINIFKNTAILSLILGLTTMLFSEKMRNNISFIEENLAGELKYIEIKKDLYNPKVYEEGLKDLLKTKEFKYVKYLNIYTNPGEKSIYRYTDKDNQTNKLTRRGWNSVGFTSKAKSVGFDVGIDYRPILTSSIIFGCSFCIGIASFIIYIALLIRFKLRFRKKLIYREV